MKKLVLIRHGQSQWNMENRFTGWTDVPLSARGIEEAKQAGKTLLEHGFSFGMAHTSYLKRAIKTLWIVLEEMDQMYIPISTTWRLNEKHYGALQGLDKAETTGKYGEDQVKLWRRGFNITSPALDAEDLRSALKDMRYRGIDPQLLPHTESLEGTIKRIMPYWEEAIIPSLQLHNEIIIAAHGNSLRGIVMFLKNLTQEEVLELNIPTGIPYVFELDDNLGYVRDYYLADEETLKKLVQDVAAQASVKKE